MTREDRSRVILSCARVLFVNGESTEQTTTAAERLSASLESRATIFPRWGEVEVQTEDADGSFMAAIEAIPAGVDMNRVASAMRIVDEVCSGRLPSARAPEALAKAAKSPPAPTWLFTLAVGVGAVALAVLFGVRHLTAAALIFGSAAIGAIVRRMWARHSTNLFVQPFSAALVAGVIGALAVRYDLSSSLRLVAVCPCMVLVPGAHFLNGMMDLIRGRMNLGAARLLYALFIVVAISAGLLVGLTLLGVSLPVDPTGRAVPLWQDVIAAGVAVACYGTFFSAPLNMLSWSVAAGTLAHAVRWVALARFDAGPATGAFVASLVVGAIIAPVSRRFRMPFAAIGFASVVSMMPGVFMFRVASGLVQLANTSQRTWELMAATLADASVAILIILSISVGLILPKLIVDYAEQRAPKS